MQTQLTITEAVGLAYVRKMQRLAAIRDELDELNWSGFICPRDLMLLEDHGYMLDFDTGLVIDTVGAVDAQVVPV